MKCIQCGQELEEGAKFCYSCGAKVQNTFCSQCGAEMPSDAKFCGSCGSKTSNDSSLSTSDKYAIETSLSESGRKLVNELKKQTSEFTYGAQSKTQDIQAQISERSKDVLHYLNKAYLFSAIGMFLSPLLPFMQVKGLANLTVNFVVFTGGSKPQVLDGVFYMVIAAIALLLWYMNKKLGMLVCSLATIVLFAIFTVNLINKVIASFRGQNVVYLEWQIGFYLVMISAIVFVLSGIFYYLLSKKAQKSAQFTNKQIKQEDKRQMKMYCLNCNKLYDSSDKFCHICGNKLEDELGCYAVQFLRGDQNAVEKIYRCTEGWVRALVCQSLRGADVEDCMQELYLRAFKNMKQFKGQPAAFRGWFNTVVKSGIIDYVRSQKKTWDYQAEKTDDTEDEFFDIADESIELNPEARLDKKEAYNLMDVLLNELTEEQRLCIELFYIENKKQKEIAEYLNIPLGTVKSRLFSSKEILNTKIREMEKKQGICLFGMSPIWYFMWLAHGENSDAIMAETLSKISHLLAASGAGAAQAAGKAAAKGNVLAAKTASSAGAKAAATKAAGLGVKSLATKIAIGVVTLSFVGAGIAYSAGVFSPSQQKSQETEVSTQETNNKEEDAPEVDPVKKAMYEQYSDILDNASSYDFGSVPSNKPRTYMYALVYMDSANPDIPQLLLKTEYDYNVNTVKIFSFDKDTKQAYEVQNTKGIIEGVASAGGFRGSLTVDKDKNGLIAVSWASVSGDGFGYRYTLSGPGAISTKEWEGTITDLPDDMKGEEISWSDSRDRTLIAKAFSDVSIFDKKQITVQGRLRYLTLQEILDLQGMQYPAQMDFTEREYVFVLDKKQDVAGRAAYDSSYKIMRTTMIEVDPQDGLDQYLDKDIKMTYSVDDTMHPHDARIPMYSPFTKNVTFSE